MEHARNLLPNNIILLYNSLCERVGAFTQSKEPKTGTNHWLEIVLWFHHSLVLFECKLNWITRHESLQPIGLENGPRNYSSQNELQLTLFYTGPAYIGIWLVHINIVTRIRGRLFISIDIWWMKHINSVIFDGVWEWMQMGNIQISNYPASIFAMGNSGAYALASSCCLVDFIWV